MTIEQRKGRRIVDSLGRLRGLHQYVIGLAGGHEDFVLHSRHAGQRIAVLGDESERLVDNRRDVHGEAGVDEAQQQVVAVRGRAGRGPEHLQCRAGYVRAVKRNAVHEVVACAVIDRGWIAGVVVGVRRAGGAGESATIRRQAVPRPGRREAGRMYRRVNGGVLHRIDLAQHESQLVVKGRGSSRQWLAITRGIG